MRARNDTKMLVLIALIVAFQGYLVLSGGGGTSPDDSDRQEQLLLQHSEQQAPSRAHGEGDHQRFGGGDGQPAGLYQANGPAPGSTSMQPPRDGGGVPLPPQSPLQAGAQQPRPEPRVRAKHQPDATEQVLMGILYLEANGSHPLNRRQAQAIRDILVRSEATKEAIPTAKKALEAVLSDEQRALVASRRAARETSGKPLPPESLRQLLASAVQLLRTR